jgi:hypothetical protein
MANDTGYIQNVRETLGEYAVKTRHALKGTFSGSYHNEHPEGEMVTEEGVDLGYLHNLVNEEVQGRRFTDYQGAIHAAISYVRNDREDEMNRTDLKNLLKFGYEMDRNMQALSQQYDNLDEKAADRLQNDPPEDPDALLHLETILDYAPRTDDLEDHIHRLSLSIEDFVKNETGDEQEYQELREAAMHEVDDVIENESERVFKNTQYLLKDD